MATLIRDARPGDGPLVFHFICALAEYEKLRHEVTATREGIEAALFAPGATAFAAIAEQEGKPVGMALYFYNFSTFLGRRGLYIEDLFVEPAMRGRGIGKQLLAYLAAKAVREGCGRMEWWVLDWNAPSIAFYQSLGAQAMDEWTVYRLQGEALQQLASQPLTADAVA